MIMWQNMVECVTAVLVPAAVVAAAWLLWRKNPCFSGVCIVLPVCGKTEDIEMRLREIDALRRSSGFRNAAVLAVDMGADSETSENVRRILSEFYSVEWISADELIERLGKDAHVRPDDR